MSMAAARQAAEYRLAEHYLEKLRAAAACVRQGRASLRYGLHLFDQEAQNIQYWQAQAVNRASEDMRWTRLCKEFPLAGHEVLVLRVHAGDLLGWLEAARTAAQQIGDDAAERVILHQLNIACYRLGLLDRIGSYASQLLEMGQVAGDTQAIARGHEGLGRLAEERGMYGEAESHYQAALAGYTELGLDTSVGHALQGLGSIAFYLGDYQQAYAYFARHLRLMEDAGNHSELCSALLALGDTLIRQGSYTEAEAYLVRGVKLSRTHGFQRLLGMGLINLGLASVAQHEVERALEYLKEGIEAVRAVGVQRQIIYGLSLLGYAQTRLGALDEALKHLQEGLQMAVDAGLPRYIGALQRNLAYAHMIGRDHANARLAVQQSIAIVKSLGIMPEIIRSLTCAVVVLLESGASEQAARCAGFLIDKAEVDAYWFEVADRKLAATLDASIYQKLREEGQSLTCEALVAQVLAFTSA